MPREYRKNTSIEVLTELDVAKDAAGSQLFATGDEGMIHVEAHRLADTRQFDVGYFRLGNWLAKHPHGRGSDRTHLHFHMAMFELELDRWDDAFERFKSQILPAVARMDALTDGPALLWHLACRAPRETSLPWEPLRQVALVNLNERVSPFVQLHNLLAIAGARDAATLKRWRLSRSSFPCQTAVDYLVDEVGQALYSHLIGEFTKAERVLRTLGMQLKEIGGSKVQQRIFDELINAACEI